MLLERELVVSLKPSGQPLLHRHKSSLEATQWQHLSTRPHTGDYVGGARMHPSFLLYAFVLHIL